MFQSGAPLPVSDEQEQKRKDTVEAYKIVFASQEGVRVLNDLISAHHVYSTVFDEDPLKMSLKEGERNAVLRILALIEYNTIVE